MREKFSEIGLLVSILVTDIFVARAVQVSDVFGIINIVPGWRNGRRNGLKIRRTLGFMRVQVPPPA